MQTPHPPIPPSCPMFGVNPEPWFDLYSIGCYTKSSEGDNTDGPLLSEPGEFRQLIACVARCAWLDEAERLDMLRMSGEEDYSTNYYAKRDALAYAAAWQKWSIL